ncbi:nucleotidyltransferase family protein [Glycomyces buryatensis]|uniref:Nucleotidyltransferase family protein n=1 Tax=Glycomyces buryatensis TaxID=2570927 RepID=A0A4S8PVL4_9ACTN|nr:nucleotidyltransferase family protein [Glycomyces buryatensis]THV35600.1 nucleotidyltransferase family protein [Glycomyces buryatensis]
MSYAGLVLAAGAGRRFGQPKALVEYDGRSLLDRAVATLREGGCRQVLAVLGAQAEQAMGAAKEPFTPVLNRRWGQGMSTSLQAGLAAIPERYDGVVVTLVDLPHIRPEAVRRLIAAADDGAELAAATYDGERGHPMFFSRKHFDGIAADAAGDRGARNYLAAKAALVREVPCPGDAGDIDTPADLTALEGGAAA